MNRLIQRAQPVTKETKALYFESRACPGGGFSFYCEPDGRIIKRLMGEAAWHSLGHVLDNPGLFHPAQVQTFTQRSWQPAIVRCDCGRGTVTVHITPGAYNYGQCEACGAAYNMSGQRLNDPSTWGDDTEEYYSREA